MTEAAALARPPCGDDAPAAARLARAIIEERELARPPRRLAAAVLARATRGSWRLLNWNRFASLGPRAWIRRPLLVTGHAAIALGRDVVVWPHARIEAIATTAGPGRITIGDGTIIQPHVHLGAAVAITIGRDCLFASHVYITDHDHDWRDPATPVTKSRGLLTAPVAIGDSVWLGERVTVLKGVTIGDGAIVAAGAIVTTDVAPRTVVAGAPARAVKRYDPVRDAWLRVADD